MPLIQQERVISFFFFFYYHMTLEPSGFSFSFVTWSFSSHISLLSTHFIILSSIPFLLSEVYKISMCYLLFWLHLPCFIQQHRLLWSQSHVQCVRLERSVMISKTFKKQARHNKKNLQLAFFMFYRMGVLRTCIYWPDFWFLTIRAY